MLFNKLAPGGVILREDTAEFNLQRRGKFLNLLSYSTFNQLGRLRGEGFLP